MAIGQSDGGIVLDLTVNDQGLKKETRNLKSEAAKLAAEYRKAGMSQSEAFKKAWSEIERTKASTDKVTVSTKKFGQQAQTTGTQASAAIAKIGLGLKSLLTYFIGIQTVFAAIRFSGASAELATQTEASVQRLVDIYGSASDSVGDFIDANARALGMSKAAAASFSSVYGNLFSVWADQATNAELTNRYLNMTAVVASKTGRTVEDVQERVRSGLLGNTEAIEDLGIFVNVKTIEMTDAFQRMANGKSWEQLDAYTQQQIRSMAILEQATAKYGSQVAQTSATTRSQFRAAYEDFKNSWGNIVNYALLPVLRTLTRILDVATKGLNAISRLIGATNKIGANSTEQEEKTKKTAENIDEQVSSQKKLNREVKKTLAGFDEIQILSSGAGDAYDGMMPEESESLMSSITLEPEKGDENIVQTAEEKLSTIIAGVGFLIAALGIILICFGHIGWGIGLLIAGIAIFTVSRASLSDETDKKTQEKLDAIVAIASAALLALGIILLFTPASLPLAIGLIIAGAAGLAYEAVLNWDFVKEKAEYIFTEFGGIIAAAGAALVVLGIILCCTGTGLPLGVGLIAAGAAAISGVVAYNTDWNFVKEKIKEAWESAMSWVEENGGLVLGILLVLTGIGAPIGLAIIFDYVYSKFTGKQPSLGEGILDMIKKTWKNIKDYWNNNISNVWTLKFWLDLAKIAGNGLIGGFEAAINGIIGMFEKMINRIVNGLNKISFDIPDWLGGGSFGINIPNVSLGRVSIPRLAKGTVVPPNKEFMAVLGDNTKEHEIVSPVSTMKQAFMEAMIEMGSNFGGGNTEVVLEIDGREFGRAVVEQGNRENRKIGTRLVIV